MYFLKIYWFKGTNHLFGAGGDPRVKSIKNSSFKTCIFCTKSIFLKVFRRGYQNFMLYSDSTYQITLKSVIKDIN